MNMERDTIVLTDRFMGPEGSANGGYACGIAAKTVGRAAEVWGARNTSCSLMCGVVLAYQASQALPSINGAWPLHLSRISARSWRPKTTAAVRTLVVVMDSVLTEHPSEVTLRGDQHPVQAFPTAAADPSFRVGIGPRRH
jgi:hypothetical protein